MIDLQRLAAALRAAEGLRLRPYQDTAIVPQLTIGYGHNLTAKGITQNIANAMLQEDIADAQRLAVSIQWFAALDTVRQNAILEMVFNIGPQRLAGFVNMIDAIKVRDWNRAGAEMLHSAWAGQVGPTRAGRLSSMIRNGVWTNGKD